MEDVGLLAVKLVLELVAGTSSQLGSLSAGTILGPGTGEAVWPGWTVLDVGPRIGAERLKTQNKMGCCATF